MTDRAHCKLLYDEDEDLHEYESFYDFSASYADAAATAETVGPVSENASPQSAAAVPEGGEEGSDGEEAVVEVSRTLGVTDLGELVLLDGKTVGNRKWSRYVCVCVSWRVVPRGAIVFSWHFFPVSRQQ